MTKRSICILFAIGVCSVPAIFAQSKISREQALEDLANAERAFAAFTVKEGFRDGFIKFFADDGIGFGPHPQKTKIELQNTPPTTGTRRVIFNWAPIYGDISAAGDMGYTTGPVLYTDVTDNPRPPRHGLYFSVWQKQADGSWKVVIDMGVNTPEAVASIDAKFRAANPPQAPSSKKVVVSNDHKMIDHQLWSVIAKKNALAGYRSFLAADFRIHRQGIMPVTSVDGLAGVLKQTKFEFIDGKVSISNDMAFTYGKYETADHSVDAETGYYVHVWRRDASGKWKLVADVQNPLTPAK